MKTNILGIYEDEDVLLHAIDKLQADGIVVADVYSPFPIHGIWSRLKLTTRLPYATFVYGAVGAVAIFMMLYWMSVVSYPLKFGGKPLNTLSFIIIMFVGTIFIGTLLTFLTYLGREKMFPGKQVVLPDPRSTEDKFVLVIANTEDMNDQETKHLMKMLKETGATEIKESTVNDHE
ncbi:MAG: DUF3341 domain-containing protein [Bacteroidetes bacterium]|jgi:hypothetical protein|nr:DUF3341 domain-containing protein [Bacteroidota bacterium]PKP30657.1 MAG: hypothetical protein CVT99_12565 [Bacteroidetes bacterium HGW-Bacteroidetes-16]